jgi:hydrophobic/amphiphilic exporter-1 (mainly G- bacteria), HAE1 family
MVKKHNESIYLEKLEFDEKLNDSWMAFFIDRTRFTWLIIIVIFVAWFLWLRGLPLESSPEVDIWIAVISTTFPGASPETMEDLVTKKIEKQIAKVKWIDTITSTSMNSVSVIQVQLLSSADKQTAMNDLKDKADLAKSDLPEDAKDPVVKEISLDDSPIWTFSISWDYNGFELYDYAKKIQEELEKNPLVSEVNISWWEQKELWVFIDPKKLQEYGLQLSQVNTSIQNTNMTLPIWDIDVWAYKHSINVDSRFYDLEKLKNVVVAKKWDTWIVYLKDIAEVKESPKKITSISRLSIWWKPSESAVTLWVVKKSGWSIVNLVTEGEKTLESMKERWILPENLNIKTILDQAERIKLDLSHLVRDWIITVLLVFFTLLLIIWAKEALVAWTAVPLVFLITFAVMSAFGQTLNFLSMFALILSLWLLVDDAIVVISAINQYKKSWKFTTREAALLVIRDYKKVLTTTTLTVTFIFSSMLFMSWIIWKYIFSIPFVVTVTLLASLVIAITLNPALAVFISWRNSKTDLSKHDHITWVKWFFKRALDNWFISIHFLETKYWQAISYLIEKTKRVVIFLVCILLLFFTALALPVTWLLKSDFFPKWDEDNFSVNIELEPGTKLDVTSEVSKKVEELLLKEKEVDSFSTSIWSLASSDWWWSSAEHYANITVNLIKKEYWRKENSMDITSRLRKEVEQIKEGKVTIVEASSGPPAWWDFELKIVWDDFIVLDKIWNDVKNTLSTIPKTIDITSSRKPLPFEFNIELDNSKLALYNISIPQVAVFLRNIIDWTESTKIYKWDDEIIVRTIYDNNSVDTFDKIKDLKIKNNAWVDVSLRDLVKPNFKSSVFSISRSDQERVVTISATADAWTTWAEIKKEFDEKMKNYKLPAWYRFDTGWANEENAKSVQSLLVSMMFWLIAIVWILVLLYNSYRQAVLVMVTIPLSLIWVFYWLTLFGQPLSFPGLIWLVALFWIVVRNWIILFDKINQNLDENIPYKEAIIDAWISRLEPVVLTSICTVLWMIPITLSNPTWTSLWLSIIFWLSASTIFTLLVLPSLYYVVFRKKYLKKERNKVILIQE